MDSSKNMYWPSYMCMVHSSSHPLDTSRFLACRVPISSSMLTQHILMSILEQSNEYSSQRTQLLKQPDYTATYCYPSFFIDMHLQGRYTEASELRYLKENKQKKWGWVGWESKHLRRVLRFCTFQEME